MLIFEILNELTLPQTPQDAGTLLKRAGYLPVGKSGHFGKVWAKPGDPYVLKLFDPADRGYLSFVFLAQKSQNKHFPIFRGRPVQITHEYAAIRIERLQPPAAGLRKVIKQASDYLECINMLSHYKMAKSLTPDNLKNQKYFAGIANKFKLSYPDLAEAIELLQTLMSSNPNMLNDIDVRNCGMRGNVLVFFDPIGWGGTSATTLRKFGESSAQPEEFGPTEDELAAIDQDKKLKNKPDVRKMKIGAVPVNGNTMPYW